MQPSLDMNLPIHLFIFLEKQDSPSPATPNVGLEVDLCLILQFSSTETLPGSRVADVN